MFISWPSIEGFHNVRKTTHKYPELLNGNSTVVYRKKCKLHGSNAAIQCHLDGTIVAQSRTQELVNGNDNAGFARWVKETEESWKAVAENSLGGFLIYGEYIGNGIQKGVAVCQIPTKSFCVFAACPLDNPEILIVEPEELERIVGGILNVYVIPWHGASFSVDWDMTSEELEPVIEELNQEVLKVEACDPFVKQVFGIEGIGEGLVCFNVSKEHTGRKCFSDLAFKAKGEKHQVVKVKAPVQADPEVANSINEFVDMVLTEARLEQGAVTVNNGSQEFDKKNIGQFLGWISKDVEKETKDELEASELEWKPVAKVLVEKARSWYLKHS